LIGTLASAAIAAALYLGAPARAAGSYANQELLVSPAELGARLDRADVRVIDVRPAEAYRAGHIPGAASLAADSVNDPHAHVQGARLPDDRLAALFAGRGVDRNSHVVLYDDTGGFHAARIFWMLEYLGQQRVSILNGGVQNWTVGGGRLSRVPPRARQARFAPTPVDRRIASADRLLEHRNDPEVVVVDVRPPAKYAEGHIPWALNVPWAQNLAEDGTMKAADALLAHFASHGITPDKSIATPCQDGKASGHTYFTLRLLGFPRIRSYDRSWAEWGAADDVPKALPLEGSAEPRPDARPI
jgi:thiosulfate/3-mercaptopyruvate sulfurtransferase